MKNGRGVLLVVFCLLMIALPALAQASPLVALVNSSGQLIVSSGDGGYRWIITNPGETLAGYAWAGDRLYFALDNGTLRAADAGSQSVSEVGQAAGTLLSLSPDGSFVFTQQADGSYALRTPGGQTTPLAPLRNDAGARYSGLWANAAPLVAYWGYGGNSMIAVTDATNGATLTLDSGRSTPITPLAWRLDTAQLIYRDGSGIVRIADLGCLTSACVGNPLENGTALLPSDAADVETDGTWVYFRSGETIAAINLRCGNIDVCLGSTVTLGTNAAPQTSLHTASTTLVYTAYTQNPNDPNDREVRVVPLICLGGGSCAPQTIVTGAVAGALSADGRFAVVEQADGLSSLDLTSGAKTYLSDRGAPLAGARWQP